MPLHRLLELVGDLPLEEIHLRVRIANGLDCTLDDLEVMPAKELDDWMLLYSVEAEAQAQEAENERRRKS